MSGRSRRRTAKLSLLLAVTASVCLAQFPSSGNAVATAVTVQGQVSILKDGRQLWAVSVGDKIALQTPITTGPNGHAIFQVSDGSTFEVYPNSLATFRNNPGSLRDLIDLWEGRIRVHIEHLLGPNPNSVRTPAAVISVRGTTFDVTVDDDTETTQVDVEEGIVDVHHALLYGDQTLTDGQSVRVYRNVPLAAAGLDKGNLVRRAAHMLMDAAMTLANRNVKIGGGGPGSVGSPCKPGMAGCGGAPPVPSKGPGTPPPPATGPGFPPLP